MTRQLYADLPSDLHEADEILKRYGRWARGGSGPERCGSAEGAYRAPQDDEDRQPTEPEMPPNDVDRVRRALVPLPMMTLAVIQWLYVRPGSAAGFIKLRRSGLQPRHVRERHLEGVRLFWGNWKRLAPMTKGTIAICSNVVENCGT